MFEHFGSFCMISQVFEHFGAFYFILYDVPQVFEHFTSFWMVFLRFFRILHNFCMFCPEVFGHFASFCMVFPKFLNILVHSVWLSSGFWAFCLILYCFPEVFSWPPPGPTPWALPLFDAVHHLFLAQKGSILGPHGAPWPLPFSTQFTIYFWPRRARFRGREEEERKKNAATESGSTPAR